ncbi:hypothetical protein ACJX0J_026530, partial [Zea mays]
QMRQALFGHFIHRSIGVNWLIDAPIIFHACNDADRPIDLLHLSEGQWEHKHFHEFFKGLSGERLDSAKLAISFLWH